MGVHMLYAHSRAAESTHRVAQGINVFPRLRGKSCKRPVLSRLPAAAGAPLRPVAQRRLALRFEPRLQESIVEAADLATRGERPAASGAAHARVDASIDRVAVSDSLGEGAFGGGGAVTAHTLRYRGGRM